MAEAKRKVFAESRKEPLQPMSSSQKILVDDMETGVANDALLQECNMDLSGDRYKIYTTTSMFLRASTSYLDAKDEVDLAGMLEMVRTNRVNETAEKTGNLICTIKPGPIVKAIVNKEQMELGLLDINIRGTVISIPVKKDFNEKDRLIMSTLQTQTAKLLTGYQYSLNPDDWTIYIIAFLSIKHAVLTSMRHAAASDTRRCMFNFADIIEIVVTYHPDKDTFTIKCQPGKEAKLNVKNDAVTEK